MNPFSIFGLSRRKNWWEGENVCVDRKVIEEEPVEEEVSASKQGLQGMIHMIDMTMTSCQDGPNFHECTTHVNSNGREKTIIMKHQCCYGFSRYGKKTLNCI